MCLTCDYLNYTKLMLDKVTYGSNTQGTKFRTPHKEMEILLILSLNFVTCVLIQLVVRK